MEHRNPPGKEVQRGEVWNRIITHAEQSSSSGLSIENCLGKMNSLPSTTTPDQVDDIFFERLKDKMKSLDHLFEKMGSIDLSQLEKIDETDAVDNDAGVASAKVEPLGYTLINGVPPTPCSDATTKQTTEDSSESFGKSKIGGKTAVMFCGFQNNSADAMVSTIKTGANVRKANLGSQFLALIRNNKLQEVSVSELKNLADRILLLKNFNYVTRVKIGRRNDMPSIVFCETERHVPLSELESGVKFYKPPTDLLDEIEGMYSTVRVAGLETLSHVPASFCQKAVEESFISKYDRLIFTAESFGDSPQTVKLTHTSGLTLAQIVLDSLMKIGKPQLLKDKQEVALSHYEPDGKVFLRDPHSAELHMYLDDMSLTVEKYAENIDLRTNKQKVMDMLLPELSIPIEKRTVFASKYCDLYYRAVIIEKVDIDIVKVKYVDYGNVEEVDYSNIVFLEGEEFQFYLQLPWQAVEARLFKKRISTEIMDELIDKYSKFLMYKDKENSVVEGIPIVHLVCMDGMPLSKLLD